MGPAAKLHCDALTPRAYGPAVLQQGAIILCDSVCFLVAADEWRELFSQYSCWPQCFCMAVPSAQLRSVAWQTMRLYARAARRTAHLPLIDLLCLSKCFPVVFP